MSPTVATKYQVSGKFPRTAPGLLAGPRLSHTAVLLPHRPPGSPFKVPVHDVTDASKVKCSGPGLSPGMVRANLPQSFQVDTSKAGVAPLQVKVQGPKGERPRAWRRVGREGEGPVLRSGCVGGT